MVVWYYGCMKQLHLYINEDLYERLRREAFDNRISISQLVVGKIDLPPQGKTLEETEDALNELSRIESPEVVDALIVEKEIRKPYKPLTELPFSKKKQADNKI